MVRNVKNVRIQYLQRINLSISFEDFGNLGRSSTSPFVNSSNNSQFPLYVYEYGL